jgi:hypothetical protein
MDSAGPAGRAFATAIQGLTAKGDKKKVEWATGNRNSYWARSFNDGIKDIQNAQQAYPDYGKAPAALLLHALFPLALGHQPLGLHGVVLEHLHRAGHGELLAREDRQLLERVEVDGDTVLRFRVLARWFTKDDLRFAVRGISKVESPERLAEAIQTDDWLPVEASIRVSSVASLAQKLGGKQLYGDSELVPLRELIQNAADAVRARRLLDGKPATWGDIIVRIGKDGEQNVLEVEDNGLGMSKAVLTGPMLDFGVSYWGSHLMREEHPGLLSKPYTSTVLQQATMRGPCSPSTTP